MASGIFSSGSVSPAAIPLAVAGGAKFAGVAPSVARRRLLATRHPKPRRRQSGCAGAPQAVVGSNSDRIGSKTVGIVGREDKKIIASDPTVWAVLPGGFDDLDLKHLKQAEQGVERVAAAA